MRKNETTFFISCIESHNGVTCEKISRWIKRVLLKAGLNMNMLKPHSSRSASSSAAACTVPVDSVLKAVGWSSEKVFASYYHKTIVNEAALANAVLDKAQAYP